MTEALSALLAKLRWREWFPEKCRECGLLGIEALDIGCCRQDCAHLRDRTTASLRARLAGQKEHP